VEHTEQHGGSGGAPERRVNVGAGRREMRQSEDHDKRWMVASGDSARLWKHCKKRWGVSGSFIQRKTV
jgi:hypothetical protein